MGMRYHLRLIEEGGGQKEEGRWEDGVKVFSILG